MDQDPRATACPNNSGTKETSPCAQSSQASISPRPAKRRKLTEEDSAEQIAAGRISPKQCSEGELRLPLQAPTQIMPNTSDYQEWMGQREGPEEDTVEQSRRDGQEDDAFNGLPRKADLFRASLLIFPEIKTTQAQYDDLIEEAVKHGQSNAAHAANPTPRLIMGGGKWQSTLVTLKVEGVAGASCQYFNSDLWRYGGRVSLLHNPDWHELDSIDLKICHEHIKVSLHEAWARRSTTWSWSSDENGVFRVHPEHIHVVEMVCGYLNLAAGREVKGTVGGLFDLPHRSSRMSRCGLARYLSRSFVCFLGDVGQLDPDKTKTAGKIDPADVVDALTRVHGEPMQMLESSRRPPKDTKKSAGSDTVSIEETPVRLPSIWGACGDRPCVCGDSVMVVDTTQDQLEVRELAFGEKYLAISYVWAQHDQPHLLSYIRRAIEVTGVHSVWVDQLCINQRCDQHKARQIPRMREVYQKGYATVALVPDITEIVPTIFHAPTATVPQHRLSVAARFIWQMKCCVWRTRCWTWQEGLLGGRGYYVTQKQVLPARIVSDFLVLSYGDKREVGIGSGLMDSLGSRSLRCQIDTWSQQISLGDLLDAEDRELIQYWLMPQAKSLGEALELTRARTASYPEDQIYSVLGMVSRGEELEVVYGESRNAILRRAVNRGLLGAEILRSRSVSNRDGESWAAMDDTPEPIGRIYELGRRIRGPVQIDDTGLRFRFQRLEGLTGAYVDGNNYVRKLANSDEEIRCYMHLGGEELRTLVSRVDQILLLDLETRGFTKVLLVSGNGVNVVRLASGDVVIGHWMKVKTQVVWRVVG